MRQIRALVTRVIRFRGYYIPAAERADLVQEVMLDVWRSVIGPVSAGARNLEALARSIAYRQCVDWIRRHRAAEAARSLPEPIVRRPDLEYLEAERLRLGPQILGRLRASCRELFRLHVVLDLPYRQIGERLGRSEGALRTQMWECLKEAREIHGQLVVRGVSEAGGETGLP